MLSTIQLAVVGTVSGLANNQAANVAFNVLATFFSGATAPTAVNTGLASVADVPWNDATNKQLKLRNTGDTAWITLFDLDQTNSRAYASPYSFNAQTGTSYTFLLTDRNKVVTFNNASAVAVTLPQANTAGFTTWFADVRNLGAGLVTITPTTSTIDGAATLTIPQGFSVRIYSDGTNYFTIGLTKITEIPQNLSLTGVISPAQLSANTDNWAPTGFATALHIRFSTDASRNITGIAAPTTGRTILLENIGAQDAVLVHDATSTAANRFYCPGSANFTLGANSACWIVYDATSSRWRVIAVPAASSFTAASQAQMESASSLLVGSAPGNQQWHPSALKVWAQTTGGGTPTMNVNFNMTSVTDNGTGDWTFTIATDFSGANYAITLGSDQTSATKGDNFYGTQAAGSFKCLNRDVNGGGAVDPTTGVSVMCAGDQ